VPGGGFAKPLASFNRLLRIPIGMSKPDSVRDLPVAVTNRKARLGGYAEEAALSDMPSATPDPPAKGCFTAKG
jgi:hypothetical protein